MNSEKVCKQLLEAESEAEVQAILMAEPEMAQPKNWRPLDGRETNFNVTSNQASDGGKALTELMTNMVDAILLKRAYEEGVDPKGRYAPKTMYEAVDRFVKNLGGGKLTKLDQKDKWLREYSARNLVIGVTGGKSQKTGLPCYTFVDNGEGQTAAAFPTTFLSLSHGNKKSIEFVQGKYNMGSSGVLGYCGKLNYKLIISRRYDKRHPWAWTLVRKRPTDGMPIFEYFAPSGVVPTFNMESIEPFHLAGGKPFNSNGTSEIVTSWSTGTIVKLYDYQIGNEYLSFRGNREALNENLVETILPFRIYDFRQSPDKKRGGLRALGVDERGFYGMEWLLLKTHGSTVSVAASGDDEAPEVDQEGQATAESEVFIGEGEHPELGRVRVRGVVLRQGALPDWLNPRKHINRIFHSVHGQVQFKETRGRLSDLGFPALKDRLVIFVDASDLTFEAHNGVWKADREHINKNYWGQLYLEEVKQLIRESEDLKILQQQIAQEELDTTADEKSVELFQRLVNSDKNLADLLSGILPRISMPHGGGDGTDSGSGKKFEGKLSPSYLRFEERVKKSVFEIPINARKPIKATTDVVNDYFIRADATGKLVVVEHAQVRLSVHKHLRDGRLTLFLKPIAAEVTVGEEIDFSAALEDEWNGIPDISDKFKIRIGPPETKVDPIPPPVPRPDPKPVGPVDASQQGKKSAAPTLAMPHFQFLTRDGRELDGESTQKWDDGMSEHSGGFAKDFGDGNIKYFINYDNAYHIADKKRQKGDVAKKAITEKYKWGMLVLMLSFEQVCRSLPEIQRKAISENLDEVRRLVANAASSTVLTIADVLPRILDTSQLDVE